MPYLTVKRLVPQATYLRRDMVPCQRHRSVIKGAGILVWGAGRLVMLYVLPARKKQFYHRALPNRLTLQGFPARSQVGRCKKTVSEIIKCARARRKSGVRFNQIGFQCADSLHSRDIRLYAGGTEHYATQPSHTDQCLHDILRPRPKTTPPRLSESARHFGGSRPYRRGILGKFDRGAAFQQLSDRRADHVCHRHTSYVSAPQAKCPHGDWSCSIRFVASHNRTHDALKRPVLNEEDHPSVI